jgi:hypothetical protein
MTGRGRHSVEGYSVIKEVMREILNRENIPYQEKTDNPGILEITLDQRFFEGDSHD